MLTLTITLVDEFYNEEKGEFVPPVTLELELEHSLISLSKWESKHEKPFLGKEPKTTEEVLSYIECMIITPVFPENIVQRFSTKNFEEVNDYIDAKMTATWGTETKGKSTTEQITSELIYYWLTSYQIPWEAENWHLNRLFTLIKVFNKKNTPPEKRSRSDMLAERARINAERRAKYNTTG